MSAFKDWLTGLTSKTTPVDADELYLRDSSGTPSSKKLTWANLKSAISSVPLGEIRYFADAPTDPAWMKCDGQPHLRTDYPDLATLMPNPAWKFETITGPIGSGQSYTYHPFWTGTSWIISSKSTAEGVGIFRAVTLNGPWTQVINDSTGIVRKLPSGRLLHTGQLKDSPYTGVTRYSDDDGVTWSARANLPAGADYVPCCVVTQHGFYFPSWNSTKLNYTSDGVTWSSFTMHTSGEWNAIIQEGDYLLIFRHGQQPVEVGAGAVPSYSGSGSYMVLAPQASIYEGVQMPNEEIILISAGSKYLLSQDPIGGSVSVGRSVIGNVSPSAVLAVGDMVLVISSASLMASSECAWRSCYDSDWNIGPIAPNSPNGLVTTSTPNFAVCGGNNEALLCLCDVSFTTQWLTRVTLDPLKFNAPGIAAVAGAIPYVYTGA